MRLFLLSFFLCLMLTIEGQTTEVIEDVYGRPASGKVMFNLHPARLITVAQTDRTDILIRKTITYRAEANRDLWIESVEKDTAFRYTLAYRPDTTYSGEQTDQNVGQEDDAYLNIDYAIVLPKGIELHLETISGDMEIPAYADALYAKTIRGFVDLGLPADAAVDLQIRTVIGEIYTDFAELTLTDDSSLYSKKVNTTLGDGGRSIRLESVSGNIYVRQK